MASGEGGRFADNLRSAQGGFVEENAYEIAFTKRDACPQAMFKSGASISLSTEIPLRSKVNSKPKSLRRCVYSPRRKACRNVERGCPSVFATKRAWAALGRDLYITDLVIYTTNITIKSLIYLTSIKKIPIQTMKVVELLN